MSSEVLPSLVCHQCLRLWQQWWLRPVPIQAGYCQH
uniref:Uncharacterized protein n=1 Tax=Anguilla anguilla TaxID=7936 RepID=A0A0E9UJH8_ANGAN